MSPSQSLPPVCHPLALEKADPHLNPGPTVLVSAAHGGRSNIMAAAWAMPLDFNPPKVAVVVDKITYTRALIEGAGTFALCIPTRAQIDLTQALGTTTGADFTALGADGKLAAYGLSEDAVFAGTHTQAPLLAGCAGWLECRLLPESGIQERYDLFLGEVVAAYADARVFSEGRWHFEGHDELRTIHHVAGGHFLVAGDAHDAQPLAPVASNR